MITGEQEGLFGWIALNYSTGRLRAHPLVPAANESLDQPHPSAPSYPHEGPGNRKGPAGALDLGGSSLEITYPVQAHDDGQGPRGNARQVLVSHCGICLTMEWRRFDPAKHCPFQKWSGPQGCTGAVHLCSNHAQLQRAADAAAVMHNMM